MKYPGAAVVVVMLFLASCAGGAARAAESGASASCGLDPTELGVLDVKDVSGKVVIPRDGLWRPPHGSFVIPGSVRVVDRRAIFAGMQSFGSSSSEETVSGNVTSRGDGAVLNGSASSQTTSESHSMPSYRYYQSVTLCLIALDGTTGELVAARYGSGSKPVAYAIGNRKARQSLIREIMTNLISEWREGNS